MFSPRGGSAHVARALAEHLRDAGHQTTLLAGSRTDLGPHGDANLFYGDVRALDFDPALACDAPLRFAGPPGTVPLHPSFEERPGAPDRVFAIVDDLDFEHQVRAWSRELERAGASEADVLHLHHLTPLNEAAARVAAGVPVVGQLHGTELLMLEKIEAGPPRGWRHAAAWRTRLRGWAQLCARLAVAPAGVERAIAVLEVPRERLVSLPNGVDVEQFAPRQVDRQRLWHDALAGCEHDDVTRLADGVVFVYVGRFTAVKRLDRLIGAYADARRQTRGHAALVLIGGHPGECEGEHPAEIARRLEAPDVFLAGWQPHERLPEFLCASDAVVMASEREQFGQLLVEGMACGLPAIATASLGPASIVDDGETGWLAKAGDQAALAAAIRDAIERPEERERRGKAARRAVRDRFSWSSVVAQLADVLEEVSLVRDDQRRSAANPALSSFSA